MAELEPAKDMDDTLRDTYRKMMTEDESAPVTEGAAPAVVNESNKELTEAVKAAVDQPRGPDGKFVKAEAAPETAAPAAQNPTDQAKPETTAAPASSGTTAPPSSWSADAKALWPSLSPALQQAVLKREGEVSEGFKSYGQKVKDYEPIAQVLQPIRSMLDLNGVEPATYVRQLVAADQYLRTKPQEAIRWIAQQYGIDLGQTTAAPEDTYVDPQLAAVKQQLAGLAQNFQQQQQAGRDAEARRIQAEIEAFKKDHEHFDDVRADMSALFASGRATSLQEAYDSAVWANPNVRPKLLEAQNKAAEAKRAEEDARRAQEAKRLNAINVTTRGTSGASPAAESLDDTIRRSYKTATAAA